MSAFPGSVQPASPQDPGLDGTLVLPSGERYDEARQAWNLAIDQRPPGAALPGSAAVIWYAAARGLRVAPGLLAQMP